VSAGRAAGVRATIAAALAIVLVAAGGTFAAEPVENPHGSFQGECATCHAPDAWKPARIGPKFDHSKYGYELEGAHESAPCLLCHLTLEFSSVAGSECAECHQDVHAGELGNECERCHGTRSFIDRTDDMRSHRMTRFPLTGAHATVDCESCHGGGGGGTAMRFANTPVDCAGCHMDTFRATRNPDHIAAGFPTDCAQCHSTFGFGATNFDHAVTGFPLSGAHRTIDCQSCHEGFQFAGTPADCFSCHQADYQAASDPNHVAGGFSTDCAGCHSSSAWEPASFDHALTTFPLTGAHAAVECAACHGGGVFTGTSSECVSCHLVAYQATSDPPHVSAGFSTNCQTCHGTSTWQGATFDHSTTAFPLTGAHRAVTCFDCHGDGVYAGKDPACVACHLADYQGTSNPNHLSSGFGTDCQSCHNANGWGGASFNHDALYFPIYSGPHQGVWRGDCTTCHVQPANYNIFECILCHEHTQLRMDTKHQQVNGYSFNSQACYSCHPRGRH